MTTTRLSDRFEEAVILVAARMAGVSPRGLSGSTTLAELQLPQSDAVVILLEAAEITGCDPRPILESAPIQLARFDALTMVSLRFWSGVLPRAARLLRRSSFRRTQESLASLAASLRQGRYADGGLRGGLAHPVNGFGRSLLWFLAPLLIAGAVLLFLSYPVWGVAPQGVLPWWYPLARFVGLAFHHARPLLWIVAIGYGLLLLPGLLALIRESRRDAVRRRAGFDPE